MTRPGFLIKNEPDVGSNLDISEPDAVDFTILGNQRFGVITGCEPTVTGSSVVTVAAGVYVVNGQPVRCTSRQTTVGGSSQDFRFDLIVGDVTGFVYTVTGTASPNPVFPTLDHGAEFLDKVCVFASVLVLPGPPNLTQAQLTDKRIMVMERFATAITNGGALLNNLDPTSMATLFKIDPNGKSWWTTDTSVERVSAGTLKITNSLQVQNLAITNLNASGNVTATGDLVGDNFRQGAVNPSGTASQGDIYKNTATGTIWVYQGVAWAQLSTVPIPPGMTMMGFMTTPPAGWLLVNGQTISRAEAVGLWDAKPAWQNVANQTMTLPNATDCFYGWGEPGVKSGNATGRVTIAVANLPAHKHLVSPSTDAGGSHGHTSSMTDAGGHSHMTVHGGYYGGAHVHGVNDPGHVHYASDEPGVGAIICTYWGGLNKLDGLFNDASHTYSVEPVNGVRRGYTGVSITTTDSNHDHVTDNAPNHSHAVTINSGGGAHSHPIQESSVGGGQSLDIRPPFMGMWLYVKT